MVMGILQPVGTLHQSDLFIDMVQATSEPLAASRPTFLSRSTSLLNHTRDTTPTSNNLPSGWEPGTKTERHKRKVMCIFYEEE